VHPGLAKSGFPGLWDGRWPGARIGPAPEQSQAAKTAASVMPICSCARKGALRLVGAVIGADRSSHSPRIRQQTDHADRLQPMHSDWQPSRSTDTYFLMRTGWIQHDQDSDNSMRRFSNQSEDKKRNIGFEFIRVNRLGWAGSAGQYMKLGHRHCQSSLRRTGALSSAPGSGSAHVMPSRPEKAIDIMARASDQHRTRDKQAAFRYQQPGRGAPW